MSTSFAIERGGRRQGVPTEITKSAEPPLKGGGDVTVGIGGGDERVAAAPMAVDGDSEAVPELQLQGLSLALPNITAIETVHR